MLHPGTRAYTLRRHTVAGDDQSLSRLQRRWPQHTGPLPQVSVTRRWSACVGWQTCRLYGICHSEATQALICAGMLCTFVSAHPNTWSPHAGWRRFQSVPVYALEDANGRQRMLKYTPEHMHCLAVIWGKLAPPNTGFLAIQKMGGNQAGWRISATGVRARTLPPVILSMRVCASRLLESVSPGWAEMCRRVAHQCHQGARPDSAASGAD